MKLVILGGLGISVRFRVSLRVPGVLGTNITEMLTPTKLLLEARRQEESLPPRPGWRR